MYKNFKHVYWHCLCDKKLTLKLNYLAGFRHNCYSQSWIIIYVLRRVAQCCSVFWFVLAWVCCYRRRWELDHDTVNRNQMPGLHLQNTCIEHVTPTTTYDTHTHGPARPYRQWGNNFVMNHSRVWWNLHYVTVCTGSVQCFNLGGVHPWKNMTRKIWPYKVLQDIYKFVSLPRTMGCVWS